MPQILANANKIAYHGLSKYHFNRHENNNSAWTQNHKLLEHETLQEYLDVYRQRTDWLIYKFPESEAKWNYFKYSFMISMVEKIIRLQLEDCYPLKDIMVTELQDKKDEFLNSLWITEIEKSWMNCYV